MRLKVGHKVFSIALVLLVLMTVVAVISVRLISGVSEELATVSTRNLPASHAVARANVHILEQAIVLQRLLVAAESRSIDADDVAREEQAFKALGGKVRAEFAAARRLYHATPARTKGAAVALQRIEQALRAIEVKHQVLEGYARRIITEVFVSEAGAVSTFRSDLDRAQDEIDRGIDAFRRVVEGLAQASVDRAERDEMTVLNTNTALTALAALLGILFAALITRGLVRSVGNLVFGTKEVEEGKLDTSVEVTSSDEVGYLTRSFNGMVGELRLKERIKDTFGKYMDPRVVAGLLDHPEIAEPGGEHQVMTVFFVDLKGFTSITERLAADDTVAVVNQFFDTTTNAIHDNNGVVDKFMGDAVMAYWGPPFTGADEHAALGCRAALEVIEGLEGFRRNAFEILGDAADGVEIDLRIGLSSGEMIVGTMGSEVARNFTVMGDPVNLGSRLEGANKAYGTRVLVSEWTREMAGGAADFREIDMVRVVGKKEPVRVYELLTSDAAVKGDPAARFEAGLEAYRRQAWNEAETAFTDCLDLVPGDGASATFLERVAHLRAEPPPADWDGVWIFEKK